MAPLLTKIAFLLPLYRYTITGSSMEPVLKNGQTVLVNRLSYVFSQPQLNDIIALHDPRDNKVLIKRIIKIEGNAYFVQGDNKNASTDSRIFGMIRRSAIIGKVIQAVT